MNAPAIASNHDLMFDPSNLTVDTIKKYLCPTATDQELLLGLQIAKTYNLNPLKREVYFVKYKDDKMQVLTGYEVYVKRAERSQKYDGLEITTEGNVKDGTLKGIVKIYRKDWKNPLIHEADYSEYVQMKGLYKNGVKVGEEPNRFWREKPKTMIKKVAISQGFRLAFPDELDGMPYTPEEAANHEYLETEAVSSSSGPAPMAEKAVSPAAHDPNEDKITSDQGVALLAILTKNGWTKDDLKKYIAHEFELTSIMEIKNKHLIELRDYFSKPKPKDEAPKTIEPKDLTLE